MTPFPLAQCIRLDPLIEREILRLRARYDLSLDEFRGLYVSNEQVDRLLAAGRLPDPDAEVANGRPSDEASIASFRWRRLVEAFRLSPMDEDLLLLAAAPECDARYEVLYAYLNDDITRKWPTAELASRLLRDWAEPSAILGALAPAAPLRRSRLIQPVASPSGRPALLNGGFAMHPAVSLWLHGQSPWLAAEYAGLAWVPPEQLPLSTEAARVRAAPLVHLLTHSCRAGRTLPGIALLGRPGTGRASTGAAIARGAGRALVRVDLRGLSDEADVGAGMLAQVHLSLRLETAVVLVEGIGRGEGEHRCDRSAAAFAAASAGWPGDALLVLRTTVEEAWRECVGSRRIVEVRCDSDSHDARVDCWREAALAEQVVMSDAEIGGLAGKFRLSSGQVRAAIATACDLAILAGHGGSPDARQLTQAARLGSDHSLGKLATKVRCKHEWGDLVVPALTLQRLRDLAAAIQHRLVVYDKWGFGARVTAASGIRALFAGGSGTGKTMAAGVIARELGLDLYRIDLSGVVSKYIGETEKNLDRIFAAARTANAILFLDEAEAILGKRSEVKDAHDRYANIEVAYLLQKLEEYDGIVILATNLKHNIDEAFHRRMQNVIDFPRPDVAERERIWRGMFPRAAPVDQEVDFRFLAKQFDLAGGEICNVVLDAAFLAAQDGGVIGMRAIVEALSRQLAKQGKTPTGAEFRQYQGLMAAGR